MGEDRKGEVIEEEKQDQGIEEIEHECDYDEDGFCPTCGQVQEPDDFSGGSLGNHDR